MRRKMLSAAVAAAVSFGAQAEQPFSDFYVFGDSLLDTGNFSYATNDGGVIATELLAKALGLNIDILANGGNNYAVGGYQTADVLDSIVGGVALQDPANTLTTRGGNFNSYLIDNPSASGDALYFLDGGGNDLAGTWSSAPDQEAAIQASARNMATAVGALSNAGANYIMLANLPDMGRIPLTQLAALADPNDAVLASTAAAGYNQALEIFVNQTGANVIPVDFQGFIDLIIRDADQFGFASGVDAAVTGAAIDQVYTCYDNGLGGSTGPSTSCFEHPVYGVDGTAPDPDSLIFNDFLHPTGKTHALAADYMADIIIAPRKVGLLPQMGLSAARSQFSAVANEMRQSRWKDVKSGWFISGASGTSELDGGLSPEDDRYSSTVGLIKSLDDNHFLGVAVTLGQNELDVDGSSFEANNYGLNILYGYRAGAWFLEGALGYTNMDYSDLARDFNIGSQTYTAKGDTEGYALGLDLLAGYNLLDESSQFVFGPVLGLQTIHAFVNGYTESGGEISNYDWGNQSTESMQLRAGFMGSMQLTKTILIDAEMYHTDEQEGGFESINVTNTNLNFGQYRLPGAYVDEGGFVTANLGAAMDLGDGKLRLSYNYSGQADGSELVSLTYSAAF
ncbi:autotransporter domain-containing protein [Endozoicomonas sp. ONNA1]|uniref:autotransporter domain-containing protein n=2 Tax=unclassified Endozoicomonas TaxID=2644528 RepID=UPI0021491811|nr:autotransporter domain-containing SGNH/GDSL hydrolase family protein [Endozoicomonas sp. ONNA1]